MLRKEYHLFGLCRLFTETKQEGTIKDYLQVQITK